MKRAVSLSLIPMAVLAGCANLAPRYDQPQAPVPAAWPSSTATSSTAPLNTGWRDVFVDPRLVAVVDMAVANNRDLRVAALNIDRAQAQYGIASAAALPSINADLTGSRSRSAGGLNTNTQAGISQRFTADLALTSYEIDFFGRVRNLGDAALQTYFGTAETRRSTQISLVASVATAWLQLATDLQRLELARGTLESQRTSYNLIDRAHELGAQSGIALAQARTTVESARADVANFDSQVEQDRNALTLLVGATPPDALLPQAGAATVEAARLLMPPEGLPASVLQQRPDVLAAERALQSSNANIGAARAAFFPRITLTGSAGSSSRELSGLFQSGSSIWSFAPSITLPIFDAGLNRANLKVAEVQREIQLANYEKTLQTAFREVADALAARRTLGERLSAQQALVAASSRNYELSQALFKSGGGAYLDVLDAQRSLYTAQQTLISLQLIEQTNRVTVYKVLGGGWTDVTVPAGSPVAVR